MAKAKKNEKTKTASTKSAAKKQPAKAKKSDSSAVAAAGKTTNKVKAAEPKPTLRKGQTAPNGDARPVVVVTHDQIARKAYEIWLAKGRPHGQDESNWLEAKAALEGI